MYSCKYKGGEHLTTVDSVKMGERIKKQRLLNGYSREKLAEMADITPRFCYDLELGLKNMSVNTLCKISDSLHVPVDYILFGPDSKSSGLDSLMGIIGTCPSDKLEHLEQIISHFIQAVQNTTA